MDKRKKESGNADLWDYRHMKTLMDVLESDTNGIVNSEYHKLELIKHLCAIWDVSIVVNTKGEMNLLFTLELLARHCLEHGRREVLERKNEDDNA